jgi:hypothetical protein
LTTWNELFGEGKKDEKKSFVCHSCRAAFLAEEFRQFCSVECGDSYYKKIMTKKESRYKKEITKKESPKFKRACRRCKKEFMGGIADFYCNAKCRFSMPAKEYKAVCHKCSKIFYKPGGRWAQKWRICYECYLLRKKNSMHRMKIDE